MLPSKEWPTILPSSNHLIISNLSTIPKPNTYISIYLQDQVPYIILYPTAGCFFIKNHLHPSPSTTIDPTSAASPAFITTFRSLFNSGDANWKASLVHCGPLLRTPRGKPGKHQRFFNGFLATPFYTSAFKMSEGLSIVH